MRTRLLAVPALTTALALSVAGCGGSGSDAGDAAKTVSVTVEGAGAVTTDQNLAKKVPSEIADKGKITVATNAPYAPFIDFVTEGQTDKFKGLDYDLFVAASAKLGLTAEFTQQPFDGLVPGLQAAKYDAIAGGITDKKERQAVATFVDYTASGTGFLVKAGNPLGVKTVAELCGKKVAVQKSSNQAKNLAAYSKASCAASPITVSEYPENPQAAQALLAGNVDVFAATIVNLVDTAEQLKGKAELVDDPASPAGWQPSPNGFGFLKADKELATAYQAALQAMVDDGTYGKVLEHYKQPRIGLKQITIDQAVD